MSIARWRLMRRLARNRRIGPPPNSWTGFPEGTAYSADPPMNPVAPPGSRARLRPGPLSFVSIRSKMVPQVTCSRGRIARSLRALWTVGLVVSPPVVATCMVDLSTVPAPETWLTEADLQIGSALEGATFSTVGDLRVAKDGNHLYVLEPRISRVSVWTVTGSILLEIERPGQGPGDFTAPRRIWTDSVGFSVLDRRGIAFFTDDGVLRERVSSPPGTISWRGFGLRPELLLSDGSFLAVPQVPAAASAGWLGDDPFQEVPVLHVQKHLSGWTTDTLLLADQRNAGLHIRPEGATAAFSWAYHTRQPFGRGDIVQFDPSEGSTLIVRSAGDGELDLFAVAPVSDTTWRRHVSVGPVPVPHERVDEYANVLVERVVSRSASTAQPLSRRQAASVVNDALHVPEYYPAADFATIASTGELWLRTPAAVDTLRVWYAVGRRDVPGALRRVLLPPRFLARDATDTHVWGVRRDSLGVNYVEGRKLVLRDARS